MEKGDGREAATAEEGGPELEVELTLGGEPAALDRGWRAAVPAGGGGAAQRLRSTYYDTGDFRLRRRGFTLRIREDGERLVQTLKSDGPSPASAVLRRNEWSQPVESPVPSLPVAPDPEVCNAVGPLESVELAPAFSTDVMRRTAMVEVAAPDHGTALIELALDSGEIRARNRCDTVSELELELVRGRQARFTSLPRRCTPPRRSASRRRARPSAAISSPAERAIRATRRRHLRWCRASPWTRPSARSFGPVPTSAQQIRMRYWTAAIPKACTSFAWRCAECARPSWSSSPFSRARTPPGWRGRRAVSSTCSAPARDWDVFIAETLLAVRAARPDDDTLEQLAAAAQAERARAYEQAEALRAPEYTEFILRFGGWIETAGWRDGANRAVLGRPLASLGGHLLDKRHKRVLKHGRGFEQLSDTDLHRLRISLKKLRYAGEFFAAQFPDGEPRPYIRTLRRLQDEFGWLNDAAVAEHCLKELLAANRQSENFTALGVGAGQVIGWNARAWADARARIAEDWHAFAATEPYWRAAAAGSPT